MTPPNDTQPIEQQRDALKDSEKKAAEQQPRSYDERNEEDKIVQVNPTDPKSDKAIRGIDPKQ